MNTPQDQTNLWAPWRMEYIQSLGDAPAEPGTEPACFMCDAAEHLGDNDAMRDRLVLGYDDDIFLMMNRFPYTNGHMLVVPKRHIAELSGLSAQERAGLMDWTDRACRLLQAAVNPQGINVGINFGRCAGAGVPGHLHVHVLPRWNGDTNFMATVGRVRVIPQAMEASYNNLRQTLNQMDEVEGVA